MGRTDCTEPQCLYKGDLYLYVTWCILRLRAKNLGSEALTLIDLGYRREVHKNSPLMGYYATSSGNLLSTFRDYLPVSNYHYPLRNDPKKRCSQALIMFNLLLNPLG